MDNNPPLPSQLIATLGGGARGPGIRSTLSCRRCQPADTPKELRGSWFPPRGPASLTSLILPRVRRWHFVCVIKVTFERGGKPASDRLEGPLLSFHILVAMIAGVTITAALQRPNHLALPLFFLLLLALLGGMVVASVSAFSDVELLRHKILGLRRQVSDLIFLNGSAGSGNSEIDSSQPAINGPGYFSPLRDSDFHHRRHVRQPSKGSDNAPGTIYVRGRGDTGRAIQD